MNNPYYRITTPYGGWYETDNRGYVVRCDNGLDKINASLHDLMTWQITGILKVDNFGRIGYVVRLDEAIAIKDLSHKNGTPKYAIQDIDHGTKRIHDNHKVHGVKSVYLIEKGGHKV